MEIVIEKLLEKPDVTVIDIRPEHEFKRQYTGLCQYSRR